MYVCSTRRIVNDKTLKQTFFRILFNFQCFIFIIISLLVLLKCSNSDAVLATEDILITQENVNGLKKKKRETHKNANFFF